MLSTLQRRAGASLAQRAFRVSPALRWRHPAELSNSELELQLQLASPSDGLNSMPRHEMIRKLEGIVDDAGGHASALGLTTCQKLADAKRREEITANQISPSSLYKCTVFAKLRHQRKVRAAFKEAKTVAFPATNENFVTLEGPYHQVLQERKELLSALSTATSQETIYSFSGSLIHEVMDHAKKNSCEDVTTSVLRLVSDGDEVYIVAIAGENDKRRAVCTSFEELFDALRQDHEESTIPLTTLLAPPPEAQKRKRRKRRSSDFTTQDWYGRFLAFKGQVMFIEAHHRHLIPSLYTDFKRIAKDIGVVLHVGAASDLDWIRDGELAIEGEPDKVREARWEIDCTLNALKKNHTCMLLEPDMDSSTIPTSVEHGVLELKPQDDHLEAHIQAESEEATFDILTGLDFLAQKAVKPDNRRETMKQLDFSTLGIGGLGETMKMMLRRTFESRLISPRLRKELGLTHIKGVLLHGPPGTGKTLVARKIAEVLGAKEPKIVNGPEVESKWVGEAEKNIRALFEEAEEEFKAKGEDSDLHVVIFDEIDAIAKERGGSHAKSRDGALNQLLCCMDGINSIDNVIVFAMTNRKDTLDRALLRPGRLEVQLEIPAPDEMGRLEILKIHTEPMTNSDRLSECVDLEGIAASTDRFSGADLAGLVRSATSFALDDTPDEFLDDLKVNGDHFNSAVDECRRTKEAVEIDEEEYKDVYESEGAVFNA